MRLYLGSAKSHTVFILPFLPFEKMARKYRFSAHKSDKRNLKIIFANYKFEKLSNKAHYVNYTVDNFYNLQF